MRTRKCTTYQGVVSAEMGVSDDGNVMTPLRSCAGSGASDLQAGSVQLSEAMCVAMLCCGGGGGLGGDSAGKGRALDVYYRSVRLAWPVAVRQGGVVG